MTDDAARARIQESIGRLKAEVDRMQSLAADLPALKCNLTRIQAALKMLEINFCEIPAPDRENSDPADPSGSG